IDLVVVDPSRTPDDGQWFVAGVKAASIAPNRLRVQLPADMTSGSPLRITYFDVWGERLVDALAADDVMVGEVAADDTPRITGCARYGFLGESLCVCGNFPGESSAGIQIDGGVATVLGASRQVVLLALDSAMTPGPHTIKGAEGSTFPPSDSAA